MDVYRGSEGVSEGEHYTRHLQSLQTCKLNLLCGYIAILVIIVDAWCISYSTGQSGTSIPSASDHDSSDILIIVLFERLSATKVQRGLIATPIT